MMPWWSIKGFSGVILSCLLWLLSLVERPGLVIWQPGRGGGGGSCSLGGIGVCSRRGGNTAEKFQRDRDGREQRAVEMTKDWKQLKQGLLEQESGLLQLADGTVHQEAVFRQPGFHKGSPAVTKRRVAQWSGSHSKQPGTRKGLTAKVPHLLRLFESKRENQTLTLPLFLLFQLIFSYILIMFSPSRILPRPSLPPYLPNFV